MAYLTPDLVQKALSIAASYKNGGTVAAFQRGGDVDTNDRSFEDSVADAMAAGADLESALDVAEGMATETGGGDGGGDRSFEDTVADALAGGMDLNQALDFAEESSGRDDGAPAAPTGGAAPIATTAPATGLSTPEQVRSETAAGLAALDRLSRNLPQLERQRAVPQERAPTLVEQTLQETMKPEAGVMGLDPALQEAIKGQRRTPGEDLRDAGIAAAGALFGIPFAGLAGDAFKALTDPYQSAVDALAGKTLGQRQVAEPRYDENMNLVGTVIKENGNVVQINPTSYRNAFSDVLAKDYTQLNEYESKQRERDSGRDEPITEEEVAMEEVAAAAPERPPTIDIVPFRPQDFYYLTQQQRQGLPSMMNMRRS